MGKYLIVVVDFGAAANLNLPNGNKWTLFSQNNQPTSGSTISLLFSPIGGIAVIKPGGGLMPIFAIKFIARILLYDIYNIKIKIVKVSAGFL